MRILNSCVVQQFSNCQTWVCTLDCQTSNIKSMEKIWIAKNYEINIAKKQPFCNEKPILPKILPLNTFLP